MPKPIQSLSSTNWYSCVELSNRNHTTSDSAKVTPVVQSAAQR
jgi:hypothetical protein